MTMESKQEQQIIYLAGGCFWGLEAYMERIQGVTDAVSGYANGKGDTTSYQLLHATDHAETVKVTYDPNKISLDKLLQYYFRVIDPTSINKQGNDRGRQYRTGIYYQNEQDKVVIEAALKTLQSKYQAPIQIEVEPLKNYVEAEEYHQDYLKKNPNGYCHIDIKKADEPLIDDKKYPKPSDAENPLADMYYYSVPYYTDRVSQMPQEIGIDNRFKEHLAQYSNFWKNKNRIEKFKELGIDHFNVETIDIGLIAVLIDVKTPNFEEIARQLRLRNISGIVIVDFINLEAKSAESELLNVFGAALKKDPVPTQIVEMTKLGLVEVTRKKIKKSLRESLS